jgi:hypothetical protein
VLGKYKAMLFFPGGNPASFASIGISIDGSNTVPLMFADLAATIPVATPIVADVMGTIEFYAPPGLYLAEVAGTWSRIPVDPAFGSPVVPDVWVHMQTVPSAVWTIDHYFETKPSVSIDIGTAQVEAQVAHPTLTQTVLTFSSAQAGAAYLRR